MHLFKVLNNYGKNIILFKILINKIFVKRLILDLNK